MSLTSYRAAPPRVIFERPGLRFETVGLVLARYSCFADPRPLACGSAGLLHPALWFGYKAKSRQLWRLDIGSRRFCLRRYSAAFGRPGSDLLSRVLRQSTIGAGAFHGRVRNGNGC